MLALKTFVGRVKEFLQKTMECKNILAGKVITTNAPIAPVSGLDNIVEMDINWSNWDATPFIKYHWSANGNVHALFVEMPPTLAKDRKLQVSW